ncbi:MAG: hypothetical protein M3Z24_11265 [Chloroflexota bacterium]|nr:hypothetical protein [Chloroflexota bacterium]
MDKGTGFKLTDARGRTFNDTQWGEGVTHSTSGEGDLCTNGWVHFYDISELAVLLNPIHAGFSNPQLWEVEWSGKTLDNRGMKRGATTVTTVSQISTPSISLTQKIAFGILCAKEVCSNAQWNEWANNWLSGQDRTTTAAAATARAAAAAYAAAYAAAAYAVADAYAYANAAAANAANAAAYAAYAAAERKRQADWIIQRCGLSYKI